jgi:hypothetical protein
MAVDLGLVLLGEVAVVVDLRGLGDFLLAGVDNELGAVEPGMPPAARSSPWCRTGRS